MYICDFSRSVGAGSATTRNTRGLVRSVMRLMMPPLPAASRPSNRTQIFAPVVLHPFLQLDQLHLQRLQLRSRTPSHSSSAGAATAPAVPSPPLAPFAPAKSATWDARFRSKLR